MARLITSGFELNSLTAGVEVTTVGSGTAFTLQGTTKRTGGYAGKVIGDIGNAASGVSFKFASSNVAGNVYARIYFRIHQYPSDSQCIMGLVDTDVGVAPNSLGSIIYLQTTGKIRLVNTNSGSQVGSDSATLNLDQWYRIEICNGSTNTICEAKIDGTTFATATGSNPGGVKYLIFGSNLFSNAISPSNGEWYFDDIAVNDTTGSYQTSYPSAGQIIHLKPNAAGDANGFLVQVGGTAGSTNNFTRVNEITPDDATSYNASVVLNAEDLFNADDSGIGASDTVNVVHVGGRFANIIADATSAFKFEVEKAASGTKALSAAIIPNSTTWVTNAKVVPWLYPITLYLDPDNSVAWTKATLDTMQVGYTITAANVNTIAISTVWALVDYTPAVASKVNLGYRTLLGVGI